MRQAYGRLGAAAIVALHVGAPAALAGKVTVTSTEPTSVGVSAEDASLTEILGSLGAANGFTIEGAVDSDALRSGRWQGPLNDVLSRILKQQNYVFSGADGDRRRLVLIGKGISAPRPVTSSQTVLESAIASDEHNSSAASAAKAPKAPAPSPDDVSAVALGIVVMANNAALINHQLGHTSAPLANQATPTDAAGLASHVAAGAQALAAGLKSVCIGCASASN